MKRRNPKTSPAKPGRRPGVSLRHAWLGRELKKELERTHPAAHAPFLSETIIREKYDVSLQTVRRSLQELERQGLVYRIPSKGTFVSPPHKTRRLLVFIPNMDPNDRNWIRGSGGEIAFFLNAIGRASEADSPFELAFEASREALLRRCDELSFGRPELAAVAVFRDYTVLDALGPLLEAKGIPILFYGSSAQRARVKGMASLLYDEGRVTRLALDHLYALGHRKIGCVWVPTHHAQSARHEAWLGWMREKNLPLDEEHDLAVAYPSVADTVAFRDAELRRKGRAWTALLSTDDQFLPQIFRILRAQGRVIPDDLSLVGVNNSPGSQWCDPPATVVDLPLDADGRRIVELAALAVKGERPGWESEVTLVVRESTKGVGE